MNKKMTNTILLVEDDNLICDITRELLESLDCQVVSAYDSAQTRNIIDSEIPIDLVLLDLSLPDGNGLDLYPFLLDKRPELKIVICTGSSYDYNRKKLQKDGITAFLQKPFNLDNLMQILEELPAQGHA